MGVWYHLDLFHSCAYQIEYNRTKSHVKVDRGDKYAEPLNKEEIVTKLLREVDGL